MDTTTNLIIGAVTTEEIPSSGRTAHNAKYHQVLQPAIAQPDKWITFPTSFVAGKTTTQKQRAIHNAAIFRGLKVKTHVRGDVIYLRYMGPAEPKTTVPTETDYPRSY